MPLTITRKPNQAVRIGDDIEVKVTRVDGNQVRLTIVAPRDVNIARSELAATAKGPRT